MLFTVRVVRSWNRLPREAVHAPSLEVFRAKLGGALDNLVVYIHIHTFICVLDMEVGGPACCRGWELCDCWGPFQRQPF